MERLSEELRAKILKMSDERLRKKLIQSGHSEQLTKAMERPVLLETYAKIVEAETAYVSEFCELDVDVERLVTEAEDVNRGAVGGAAMERPMESKELSEDEKWRWRQYELDTMRL